VRAFSYSEPNLGHTDNECQDDRSLLLLHPSVSLYWPNSNLASRIRDARLSPGRALGRFDAEMALRGSPGSNRPRKSHARLPVDVASEWVRSVNATSSNRRPTASRARPKWLGFFYRGKTGGRARRHPRISVLPPETCRAAPRGPLGHAFRYPRPSLWDGGPLRSEIPGRPPWRS
jgi:hypothetical protein